jgi:hypothetical protein
MTFVRLAFFPGGTTTHYAALAAELEGVEVPPSRRVFLAGPASGGWQVVQVWDRAGDLEHFNRTFLLPAMERVGSLGFPEPPEVRDFIAADARFGTNDHGAPRITW